MSWDGEIEDFKRKIDSREYAAERGYTLDKRESRRGSTVMRNGADVIIHRRRMGVFDLNREKSILRLKRARLFADSCLQSLPETVASPSSK